MKLRFRFIKNETFQIKILLFLIVFVFLLLHNAEAVQKIPLETILYDVSPLGSSEYNDFGEVELYGKQVNLVTFKTSVFGFNDLETIYSDIRTNLPVKVERDISFLLHDEHIVENYSPTEGKLIIEKFEGSKKVEEFNFEAKGPIHNAIILPFSLRKIKDLNIGWSFDIRLPDEFKVTLVSIEDVSVPAGTFKAYHFISEPKKFEIWITTDGLRIPVKIKGCGGLDYTLSMIKRSLKEENEKEAQK